MVNVTTSDILTEQRIRRVVEQEQEWTLVWDEAFRTINMPDDYPTDTMEIPLDEGQMAEPERVHEGTEFPRDEEEYDTIPITVKKYGKEVSISWESEQYSIFDVVAQQVEKAARRMSELLNRKAYEELSGNLHPNGPVTGSGSLNFSLLTDARKEILDDKYDPQVLITNTAGENQLLNSDAFRSASDLGDEVTRDGAIGRVAGMDVMVDNSGLLGTDQGVAVMMDPDEYGYEVIKQDVATDEYDAPERQARIFQIWTKREWKAINEEAAIQIQDS